LERYGGKVIKLAADHDTMEDIVQAIGMLPE
jgi:hypothetical protein